MARVSRLEVEGAIQEVGLVPLLYQPDPELVIKVVRGCVAGGAPAVEFTNRGEQAHLTFAAAIARLRREEPAALLGVGSVVDAPTAAIYIANGADFVVGPYLNPEVAALCGRHGVSYVPGAATPAEIAKAESCGASLVKVFPARVLGPAFVADVLGPSPHSRLIPTGGVEATQASVSAWIEAGVVAVGMGSQLIASHPKLPSDLDSLAARVTQIRDWIAEARSARGQDRGAR